MHTRLYGVLFHFLDVTSDYLQVVNEQRVSERSALNPVNGNVRQLYVYNGTDGERVLFDRIERAVGDRQMFNGCLKRIRRQFVRGQLFQYNLNNIVKLQS